MNNKTDNRQIALNLVFNSLSFLVNFIISFFFTPYLIKTVGKEAYSFFPLVNNMIGYTSVITTAIGSMAGRFITMSIYNGKVDDANTYLNSMWVTNLILSFLFALASIFCVVYIDSLLTIPSYLVQEVQLLFAFAAVAMIIGLLTGFLSLAAYVKNRIDMSSSRQLCVNIVRVSMIIVLFYFLKPSIVYMSLSALLAAIVGVGLNYQLKEKLMPELTIKPRKYFSLEIVKSLVKSGVWNSVNQLSNMLLYQLDLLITNIYLGAEMTGDYSLAKMAPILILSMLAMLSGTFIPHFNILYARQQNEELVSETCKAMIIVGLIIGLPIGFFAVFGDCFYSLWVPGQNSDMLHWMTVFTLIPMIFGGSINPVFGLFTTTNKLKIPSLVLLVSGLINVGITVILIKNTSLGVWAIIIVSGIIGILRNSTFTAMYGAHVLGKSITTFYPALFRGIVGMLLVVAVGYFYKSNVHISSWFDFFLALAVVCVVSLCLNAFVTLKRGERERLFAIVKKRLHIA